MTPEHVRLCASAEWGELVERVLAPWLVAVELDEPLAAALGRRLAGGNVEVVTADASALPFRSGQFSAVACFTMLHHVPNLSMQDRMLAELRRVLRPGGVLVGTDGTDTPQRRELHLGDVFLPVPPAELPARLAAAGFVDPVVETRDDRIRFAATARGQVKP